MHAYIHTYIHTCSRELQGSSAQCSTAASLPAQLMNAAARAPRCICIYIYRERERAREIDR